MENEIDAAKITEEVMRCKLQAWNKIDEILEHAGKEAVRVDELEDAMASIKQSLKDSEVQRASFNRDIKADITELREWFRQHDGNEMEKYDEIILSLKDLTKTIKAVQGETDENSKALMQKRIEEEKARAIQKALEEHDAPFKEYRKKAIMVVVTMVTAAMVTGLWKLTVFVSNLDKAIGAN